MGHVNPALDPRQLGADGQFLRGQELLDLARQLYGDTLLLQFSCGKESIALWLWLREAAPDLTIVPYWMYLVPDLGYQARALDYYESYFGCHIRRLPHPALYQMLNSTAWQPPETLAVLAALRLQEYDFADIENLLAADLGLDQPLIAVGIRAKDYLERLRLVNQMGVIGFGRRRFLYAIWDWSIQQVGQAILDAGIKLPVDYQMFGRTVTALNYRRLVEVKRRYPEDYQKILDWFPLIEAEVFRYERLAA